MGGYTWPLPQDIPISQPFGSNPSNGVNPVGGHTGTDFAAPLGTEVRAPGRGTIAAAQTFGAYNENRWWLTDYGGQIVVLDCGEVAFVFAHLSRYNVNVGDTVDAGEVIAWTGNTGSATTGPHLHFEALPNGWDFNNGTYGRVDPSRYCSGYFDGSTVTAQASDVTPIPQYTPDQQFLADLGIALP